MRKFEFLFALCVFGSIAPSTAARARDKTPLRFVQTIVLPGVEGRIDHMAVDVKGKRLFVAALGNNTVEVVDLARGMRSVSLKGFHEPQGIAYLAEHNKIVVANGQGGGAAFLDGKTYQVTSRVEPLDDADNVRYDPERNWVVVGYGSGALAILDAATGHRLHDTKLPGHPESFQLHNGEIYVNVPSAGQVCVVNMANPSAVASSWRLNGAEANFPMTFVAGKYVCVGCRKPPKLLFFEMATGKLAGECAIPGDTDDLFADRKNMCLYASCGEGCVAVISGGVTSGLHVERVATIPGARTSLFVPELNRLYVACRKSGGSPAEIRVFEVDSRRARASGSDLSAVVIQNQGFHFLLP